MDFMISKSQPSFSQAEEVKLSDGRDKGEATKSVTSCLYLKSSSSASSTAEPLDKDVVLRRIRHHKCLKKIQNTFQSLLGGSSSSERADMVAAHQQKWLEQDDAFSAP